MSTNAHSAAYQSEGFTYAPPVSSKPPSSVPAAFASPSLPLGQLMHVPPPTIQPNLYPMPPPVGMPLNMPPPGFLNTSLPPPPVPSYPRPPWCPPSTSAAGAYPAARAAAVPGSGYKEMSVIPSSAVSSAGAPGSLLSGKPSVSTAAVEKLNSSGVGVGVTATSTATQQQTASSVAYPSPLPHTAGVLTNQRPPATVGQLNKASDSSASAAANLVPQLQPRPAFSLGVRPGLPRASVASLPIQGNRPLGPLKMVTPVTQLTPSRLPGPVVGQGMRVPVQPVTTAPTTHVTTSSPQVGQGPRSVQAPIQSAPPAAPGSQPRGTIRPTSAQPDSTNNQPRPTGPLVGQGPRGAVHPGPPVSNSNQPRGVLPASQPRGTVRPVSTQPNSTNGQPRATGSIQGQSPHSAVRPGAPNQPTGPQGASQPRAPVRPVSALPGLLAASNLQTSPSSQLSVASGIPSVPRHPAQPAGVVAQRPVRPLTAAAEAGVGKGRLLTASSRVYVLNSNSSPLCKDVEVSL